MQLKRLHWVEDFGSLRAYLDIEIQGIRINSIRLYEENDSQWFEYYKSGYDDLVMFDLEAQQEMFKLIGEWNDRAFV